MNKRITTSILGQMDAEAHPTVLARDVNVVPTLEIAQRLLRFELSGDSEDYIRQASALRALYKEQKYLAEFYYDVLKTRQDYLIEVADLPALDACFASIDRLERLPLKSRSFVSIKWKERDIGILIRREALQGGGIIYTTTVIECADHMRPVFRAEFRAARTQPDPFAVVATDKGWIQVAREELSASDELVLCLKAVVALHSFHYIKLRPGDIECTDIGPSFQQKPNRFLERLCAQAFVGKVPCARAVVPMMRIVPRDMNFAMNYPLEEVRRLRGSYVDDGKARTELLLYEKGGRLISDDDYPVYLSYKSLGFKEVPAVIIGRFSEHGIRVIERGHGEIIPPIMVEQKNASAGLAPVDEMSKLDLRLNALKPEPNDRLDRLNSIYFKFCRLLERKRKREKELHDFLYKFPMLIDAHVDRVHTEVRIGKFKADLVFRYKQTDQKVLLIELERDDERIFTKRNRLTYKIGHAAQQIEDWISEVRRSANEVPPWLQKEYIPGGLVVVGRSKDLTDEQRIVLKNINSNRLVKIVTYDDLLDRMNQLISSLDISLENTLHRSSPPAIETN